MSTGRSPDDITLDDLYDLATMVKDHWSYLEESEVRGQMYCPTCGEKRRMEVQALYTDSNSLVPAKVGLAVFDNIIPLLLRFECVQCSGTFSALAHKESSGVVLAIFPEGRGTLATPHTPRSVAYYLDQVQKCWSVGAYSAAVSMYRVALDHLLFGENYTEGMVGEKLGKLEKDIAAGSAPDWAKGMDTRYLGVLNTLATYALHPNDGNIEPQAVFDQQLLTAVKATFQELLVTVYELPHERQNRMAVLDRAVRDLGTR
jgi:hypothetical protein